MIYYTWSVVKYSEDFKFRQIFIFTHDAFNRRGTDVAHFGTFGSANESTAKSRTISKQTQDLKF